MDNKQIVEEGQITTVGLIALISRSFELMVNPQTGCDGALLVEIDKYNKVVRAINEAMRLAQSSALEGRGEGEAVAEVMRREVSDTVTETWLHWTDNFAINSMPAGTKLVAVYATPKVTV